MYRKYSDALHCFGLDNTADIPSSLKLLPSLCTLSSPTFKYVEKLDVPTRKCQVNLDDHDNTVPFGIILNSVAMFIKKFKTNKI